MREGILMKKVLGNVRDVAKQIVEINQFYYSAELIELIPDSLLERILTDKNLHETSVEIDKLRFKKEDELLQMLGFSDSKSKITKSVLRELADAINIKERFEELLPEQQQIVKEIKFLNNVAQTVLHR